MTPAGQPSHRLNLQAGGLRLTGYDVRQVDLANFRVPNLAYTFYLRPTRHLTQNMQPVVYETMGGQLIGCTHLALGLAWDPTSQWSPGRTNVVRLQPLEIDGGWQTPGTSTLSVSLQPVPRDPAILCPTLEKQAGVLWSIGHRTIRF
jgi:hypothetical protein